jgi:hypothetical protein
VLTGTPSIVGRIGLFLGVFFGIPLVFFLVLLWNVLYVMDGSERAVGQTPVEPLIFPGLLLVVSVVLRSGFVMSAMRRSRGVR